MNTYGALSKEEPTGSHVAPEDDAQVSATEVDLDDAGLYINRELSWLAMNERILEEALDASHPLLERIKFIAICGSNLDEFFMVRVAGLVKQLMKGTVKNPPDGMTPLEQLNAIRARCLGLLERYEHCWRDELLPALTRSGIHIHAMSDLSEPQAEQLRRHFEVHIFPALTPMAMDIARPFPFISNLSLNLAIIVKDDRGKERYARLKVPTGQFPRLVPVPAGPFERGDEEDDRGEMHFVLLEDLVASNLDMLFPGMTIVATHPFRITRNAEIEIALDQSSDLLSAVEEGVDTRKFGCPVRLQIDGSMPQHLADIFATNLSITADRVYRFDGLLGLADLWEMLSIDRPDLKDRPFLPHTPPELDEDRDIFAAVRKRDWVLYHPYDSFGITVNLLRQAARDPDVLAIKTTLYRIDKRSPIVDALMEARHNGKSVTALIELKAKFDEESNIEWSRALEHAGVHVVYGHVDLKIHSKLLLIVRREGDDIVEYCMLSSGNFNSVTARIYGDIAYLTSDREIGADVVDLFNTLTGYSAKAAYRRLLVAPHTLGTGMLSRIEREIENQRRHGNGYIAFKCNGLLEPDIIKALYRASMAGVRVALNVRNLCALRPGAEGVSENIVETSIVGRFLEHARIYYFENNGDPEVLLGSSDLMPRNLYRRVEVLFPVPDLSLRRNIVEWMLEPSFDDNVKSRFLTPDGTYVRVAREKGDEPLNYQGFLIEHRGAWHVL